MAMLESLVSMLILTAGVLSLLWMLQRALVIQRQQIYRDQAMQVADNLQQRMLINAGHAKAYLRVWDAPSTPLVIDCAAAACNGAQLAVWDLHETHLALKQLPQGDISVTLLQIPGQWWAITVAWRDTEEAFRTHEAAGSPSCPQDKSCWRLVFSLA